MHTGIIAPHILRNQDDTNPKLLRRNTPERLGFAPPALPIPHQAAGAQDPQQSKPQGANLMARLRRRPQMRPAM